MAEIQFGGNVATIILQNRQIILHYDELHEIAQIYHKFYVRESVEDYLKKHGREDLINDSRLDSVVMSIMAEAKYIMDDYQTIADALIDILGVTV